MQISKLSTQSFGHEHKCSSCVSKRQESYSNPNKTQNNGLTVTRNALIAALVGLLSSCQSDTYTISTTEEGYPIIYNQDGDCIDFVPRSLQKEYDKIMEEKELNN